MNLISTIGTYTRLTIEAPATFKTGALSISCAELEGAHSEPLL